MQLVCPLVRSQIKELVVARRQRYDLRERYGGRLDPTGVDVIHEMAQDDIRVHKKEGDPKEGMWHFQDETRHAWRA